MELGRRLLQLWLVGASLWIVGWSAVIYNAYQEPYDLWLLLDPEDDRYRQCWPKGPDRYEAPTQTTARIRRVAMCYRALNRISQTTSRLTVLKQGAVTILAGPALVLAASALLAWLAGVKRSKP